MKFVLILVIIFSFTENIFPQKDFFKGNPIIHNYSPTEYNGDAQNWAVAQNKDGIVYFGNNLGVLEFDGTNWNLIKLTNNSPTRTVEIYKDTVYISGNSEFGYLTTDSLGSTVYKSISKKLPKNKKQFGDIWYILFSAGKKYFIGYNDIFVLENNEIKIIHLNYKVDNAFIINDELILRSQDSVFIFIDNKMQKNNILSNYVNNESYLCKINNDELIIINKQSVKINFKKILGDKKEFITPINIEKNKDLLNTRLFNHSVDKNGNIAFAGLGGLYIYDKNFNLLHILNRENGLPTNDILNTSFDYYGNIWVTHGKGISYVEFNSNITIYNNGQNVFDSNLLITIFKRKIYLNSLSAVKTLEKGAEKFKDFDNAEYNNFGYVKIKTDNDSALIISSNNKLYYTFGEEFKLLDVSEDEIILSLAWTAKHKNLIFYGTTENVKYIKINEKNNELFVDSSFSFNTRGMFSNMASDNNGNIWATSYYNGIYKLSYNSKLNGFNINHYSTKNGLKQNLNKIYFNKKLNKLLVLNNKIYTTKEKYNPNKKEYSFIIDTAFFKELAHKKVNIYASINNKIILVGGSTVYSYILKNNIWVIDSVSYKRLANFTPTEPMIYIDENNIEWYPFSNELIRINPSKFKKIIIKPLPIIINSIFLGEDSLIYGGRDTNIYNNIIKFDYENNSIGFEYSTPYYVGENKYKHKLIGFDKEWSNYTNETKVKYTNLYEGDYVFIVKAINIYGIESGTTSFSFTILPVWYRTIYAYSSFFMLFGLFIIVIVYLFTRNLKIRNIRLEKLIKDRTKEIQHKNILITDSINYAKYIQKAVLPSIKTINNVFNNSFVYFKPRDIVSGDFYWYKQRNESHFIAISDCTGHGVPGAFMSMIGNTLLNQIITENKVKTPSDILNRLNTEIKMAFADSYSQDDGMDITVCKINYDNNIFELSLANHIAIIVKNNEIKEIKGDIYSIGGPFAKPENKSFTNISMPIEKGTNLYMFSDGYADQFGGDNNKKFNMNRFKELLIKIADIEMSEQQNIINKYFKDWKSNLKQIDDVLVMGIRF